MVGRPELYPVKKVIGFDQTMLDAVDRWRRQQTPIPTVSAAIRKLVELALTVRAEAASASKPTADAEAAPRKSPRQKRR